ncbi:hypothetical protein T12_12929 [Trichinella patagoniensis]|uniref:Uncharacterized protein n=1 Tax=Trichinella patagoniensis TaxID=990121 RepID=A0A0V0ZPD1_9BILA|nr:hypothetical protein T12_12929 [Trichinella patagoniensis]
MEKHNAQRCCINNLQMAKVRSILIRLLVLAQAIFVILLPLYSSVQYRYLPILNKIYQLLFFTIDL